MHFRVDPLNDGHQIVKDVFRVVHGWIHEVPEREDKIESIFRVKHTVRVCTVYIDLLYLKNAPKGMQFRCMLYNDNTGYSILF